MPKGVYKDGADNQLSPYQGILRNAIINGDMRVAQRGTSFTSVSGTARVYTLDRWYVHESGNTVVDVTQSTDVPTGHPELRHSLAIEVTTADSSQDAADYFWVAHRIEGYNFAPFVGRNAVVSFFAEFPTTGTYCVALQNSAADMVYVHELTVTSTDWQLYEVPVTFDYSGGTWDYTNGRGLILNISLMCGSTSGSGTHQTWAPTHRATTNQTNGVGTVGNTFKITGVQLHPGAVALPFDPRPYAYEKHLCRRYYQSSSYDGNPLGTTATNQSAPCGFRITNIGSASRTVAGYINFPVEMRGIPSVVAYDDDGDPDKVTVPTGDTGCTISGQSPAGFAVSSSAFTHTDAKLVFGWSADAEL